MKSLPFTALVVGTTLAAVACSDGASPAVDAATQPLIDAGHYVAPTPDATIATPHADAAHDTGSTTADTGIPALDASVPMLDAGALADIVINEICGKENDYVELFNAGTTPVALAGWGVTEAKDGDGGLPGTSKPPAFFPAGTTLGPNEYALVLGAPKDGGTPFGACPASVCLQATWNISSSNGATVYLSGAANVPIEQEPFPGGATSSGQSWGRLPNGTGTFALNTQTPGVANTAP